MDVIADVFVAAGKYKNGRKVTDFCDGCMWKLHILQTQNIHKYVIVVVGRDSVKVKRNNNSVLKILKCEAC